MLLLITDTSGRNGTVALARAGMGDSADEVQVIESVPLAGGTFSAQLVPQIADLLPKHGFGKSDIDVFIVVSGPGSFTGLRVGLAAIKALAEILRKPIVPVSLLEVVALAANAKGRVLAALDAGRGELYAGEFEIAGQAAQLVREELIRRVDLSTLSSSLTVSTPDASVAAAARESGLSISELEGVTPHMIAALGWTKLQAGETVSPEQLEPNYIRRTDAEIFAKPASNGRPTS